MKACFVKVPCSLDNFQYLDLPEPILASNQVLVRWHASSLNYHDFAVVAGMKPIAGDIIPMSDGAGEVVAVGSDVKKWAVGNKVMSLFFPDWIDGAATPADIARIPGDSCEGYASERSAVDEHSLTLMPEGFSYTEAATLPCAALTAWRSLFADCKLQFGDKVLVEGSGGFSIFALQFAKAAGATVFATSSSNEKLQRMKALGADELINYKETPEWGQKVYELSGGGVDHALDVGGSTLNQSITACRIGGNVSSIGVLEGVGAEVNLRLMISRQIQIKTVMVGNRRMQEDMVKAINASGLKPVIDSSYKLSDLANAFRYQATGKHFGKIVVEY
ncbi:zinc-dependent alcohol dehydrogenase family protein [Haliea salexigens]|uniref:zinc-dependent alcohol dehydrogenase family protein n=1 Tax=Haliea salexigens TaxID=287487 RepID=UPI00048436C1|nr:NAD(P)-dependent alcohol dehydrogenase [Haliea salexigens]